MVPPAAIQSVILVFSVLLKLPMLLFTDFTTIIDFKDTIPQSVAKIPLGAPPDPEVWQVWLHLVAIKDDTAVNKAPLVALTPTTKVSVLLHPSKS